MEIRDFPVDGYEKVAEAIDAEAGLHAFIAVHDSTLGPACGGMRIWPYASVDAARTDVLRLARGMSYKSAVARTGLGGGKAVVMLDPSQKSGALLRAMGRFIDSLGGLYWTAEDVNTTVGDLEILARETRYVTGLSPESGASGNPSPYTAIGCFLGVQAVVNRIFGSSDLEGRSVAVSGTGAVGGSLVRRLVEAGAKVYANDLYMDRVEKLAEELGVIPVADYEELYSMEVDILSPCALGGTLHDESIAKLRCKGIAGAANNQLLEMRHGDLLEERGILYAPDYVINGGGIINVSLELTPEGYSEERALEMIGGIPRSLDQIFDIAKDERISTALAADRLAQRIIAEGRKS